MIDRNERLLNNKQFDRLIDLFDQSNTGLWEMNAQNEVKFFNTTFYGRFNISTDHSTLEDWINIVHPEDKSLFLDGLVKHENSKMESYKIEYRVLNKDGKSFWIEAKGLASFDENGNIDVMVGSHTDITLNKLYNSKLFELAYVDKHTKLFNREKLTDVLKQSVNASHSGTFLLLDFYQIKQIITLHDKLTSNRVIEFIGDAIRSHFDTNTNCFKISSSKFAVLSKNSHSAMAVNRKIQELNKIIDDYTESHMVGQSLKFNAAVVYFDSSKETLSPDEIINRAYLTLDKAGQNPDSIVEFFSEDTRSKVLKLNHMETHILSGLKNNEFFVEYQPILNTKNNTIHTFEALLRWKSLDFGLIRPDEFIPIAEKNKTIVQLGRYVIERACAFIADYNKLNDSATSVSINVSVVELLDLTFSTFIIQMLFRYNIKPNNLILEITETIMIDHTSSVISQLEYLRSIGVGVSLDDFGTGYASINNIIHTPLSELKIDKDIMLETISNKMLSSFICSIISLCHEYNIRVVAEGIESESMVKKAEKIGVDFLQGYYYSKPLSEDKATQYILTEPK